MAQCPITVAKRRMRVLTLCAGCANTIVGVFVVLVVAIVDVAIVSVAIVGGDCGALVAGGVKDEMERGH